MLLGMTIKTVIEEDRKKRNRRTREKGKHSMIFLFSQRIVSSVHSTHDETFFSAHNLSSLEKLPSLFSPLNLSIGEGLHKKLARICLNAEASEITSSFLSTKILIHVYLLYILLHTFCSSKSLVLINKLIYKFKFELKYIKFSDIFQSSFNPFNFRLFIDTLT